MKARCEDATPKQGKPTSNSFGKKDFLTQLWINSVQSDVDFTYV